MLAGKLALENGWSINVGGGFHHCSGDKGGGYCPYADITLLLHELFDNHENVRKAMIVDLDAHQVIHCLGSSDHIIILIHLLQFYPSHLILVVVIINVVRFCKIVT